MKKTHLRRRKEKMGAPEIQINCVGEGDGGWFDWTEEVEVEDPIGWYPDARVGKKVAEAVVKKPAQAVVKKPAQAVVRRKMTLKKETSYPHLMPICSYLAMTLGQEGFKKLLKEEEVRSEDRLEKRYLERMMREPGICKSPIYEQFCAFEVEKLGEGALQRIIRGWESGPEIVTVEEGGRTRLYVTLLAMSPFSPHIITPVIAKEQAKQDTERGHFRGAEVQVNIH